MFMFLTSYRLLNSKFQILVHSKPPACGTLAMAKRPKGHMAYGHCQTVKSQSFSKLGPFLKRAAKGPMEDQSGEKEGKTKKGLRKESEI